ncbi:MAG TPA: hypothetical protein DEH11_15575, partial [Actinobacteria bacterium]|nr:hypothetical protein [Actinomycetota bacterium]
GPAGPGAAARRAEPGQAAREASAGGHNGARHAAAPPAARTGSGQQSGRENQAGRESAVRRGVSDGDTGENVRVRPD